MFPKLVDVSDREAKSDICVNSNKFSIGRALDNSHVLEDLTVSRFHCVVSKDVGGDWVILNKSTNGTLINNALLTRDETKKLVDGDLISLNGTNKYKFEHDSDEDKIIATVVDAIVDTVEENCKRLAPPMTSTAASTSANNNSVEDELSCSICCELFVDATMLSCSHTFCKFCIEQWRKKNRVCPICRDKIGGLFVNRVVNNLIEKHLSTADEETKGHRSSLINERNSVSATTSKRGRAKATQVVQQPIVVDLAVEIPSSDSSEDDDNVFGDYDSEYSYYDYQDDYDDNYDGIPGAYYGGYGSCYTCGSRGHWANGCPNNPRRRRH